MGKNYSKDDSQVTMKNSLDGKAPFGPWLKSLPRFRNPISTPKNYNLSPPKSRLNYFHSLVEGSDLSFDVTTQTTIPINTTVLHPNTAIQLVQNCPLTVSVIPQLPFTIFGTLPSVTTKSSGNHTSSGPSSLVHHNNPNVYLSKLIPPN